MADNLSIYQKKTIEEKFDDENFVRVPITDDGIGSEFKTFKIIRK